MFNKKGKKRKKTSDETIYLKNNPKKKEYSKNKLITFIFIFICLIISILIVLFILKIIKTSFKSEVYIEEQNQSITKQEKPENITIKSNIDSIQSINFYNPPLEEYDLHIWKLIENKLDDYIELKIDEQKFFNGLIRKLKPKKIVEIGVSYGGSSALILNAIRDIEGAKLYSIDKSINHYLNHHKKTGYIVEKKFPELMDKWTLKTGILACEFIETIGNEIDLVFIDTMHTTPGEMLDWLMVLPFLKEGAIVVLHDIFWMFHRPKRYQINYSNNQVFCYIRGELILPNNGNQIFSVNIGALKLYSNQKQYYQIYFVALGNQWEYMPHDSDLKIMRDFFMKYYGEKLVEIFDKAVEYNQKFKKKY